ncbi:MAG: glycosyltransferase family 4 protein [DPANN group archaeon]|nr:glycosyltransferase family 4 protein [DPANN group archaeon]
MRPLKILIVTSFYPPFHVGGACTHAYYLANGLARAGHEVHVLYSKDAYYLKRSGTPDRKDYPNHRNVLLHEISTPLGRLGPLVTYVSGSIVFPREVREVMDQDYDLIHYHNISLLGPRIFSLGSAPKIYTAHDHWLVCPLNGFYRDHDICRKTPSPLTCARCLMHHGRPPQLWRFGDALQDGLEQIRLILTPSDYIKGFLRRQGIQTPIRRLSNFVPEPNTGPVDVLALDPVQKDPYFFFAGMMEETKGIKVLLEAFRGLPGRHLILAGTGSLDPWVKRFIEGNDLAHRIHHLGFIPGNRIGSYFHHAEAFILPSSSPENAPLTILEAMAQGTPSIGTDVGGIPEMIGRIDERLIVPRDDPLALRKVIASFDRKRYDPGRIRKIFQEHYTLDVFIGEYERIIASILK